jgi:glycosyltransferase involved in cell wall biosynthesis
MGALGMHKGFDRAVKFSVDYEIPLHIAGHPMGEAEAEILEKAKTYPWIQYLGVIGGEEKNSELAKAAAVLMPFRWPEPGCILAVEAMACGTPIIASGAGVLPEYVVDGITGFLNREDPPAILDAYNRLSEINPSDCYSRFVDHFLISRVSNEYQMCYSKVMNGESW